MTDRPTLRPLDTSRLGPIRIDAGADATRARVTREALERLAEGATDQRVAAAFDVLVDLAPDETLLLLRRLLR